MPPTAVTIANDDTLSSLIRGAQRRLVVLAPAVSAAVGAAIRDRWHALGPDAVSVILDVDSEVYRLGYGDFGALTDLDATAAELGTMVTRHEGVRIGMVIADDQTLVYAPTPQLIESGSRAPSQPNAIRLGAPPPQVEQELGQGPAGHRDQRIGLEKATRTEIRSVAADLEQNPPQSFDVSRAVRVFNAAFEFVEFELVGTFIERKTVPIPSHLSGIADEKTRRQLRTSFTILPPDDDLSGSHLEHDKSLIARKYLHHIKDQGAVIERRDKEAFNAEVKQLREAVAEFGKQVRARLQGAMDRNRATLVKAMLPLVRRRTPKTWLRSDGVKPDAATLRQFLDQDLARAFGSAERLIKGMGVRLVFKGVTYEMLSDKDFMAAAEKALPGLNGLYEQFHAARAKSPRPTPNLTQ